VGTKERRNGREVLASRGSILVRSDHKNARPEYAGGERQRLRKREGVTLGWETSGRGEGNGQNEGDERKADSIANSDDLTGEEKRGVPRLK